MTRVLVVSSDAGGTNTLVPVVRELLQRKVIVHILASGPAVKVWEQARTTATWESVDDEISESDALGMIESLQPQSMVTGAGAYNLIEHTFRRAASTLNVVCTAVVDYWANYHKRFERKFNGLTETSLPNMIGVMDEICFAEMVDVGFDPDRLTIVGAPHLEVAADFVRKSSRVDIDAWRSELGLSKTLPTFVYFSQPIDCTDASGGEGPIPQVISEPSTMREVLVSLGQACASSGTRAQFLVKAHPLETAAPLLTTATEAIIDEVDLHVIETYNTPRLICVADAVFGVNSTALLEAGFGGKPAYSVGLGKARGDSIDSFYGNRTGITTPVYDTRVIRSILCELLDSPPRSHSVPPRPNFLGSTARTVDVILDRAGAFGSPTIPK